MKNSTQHILTISQDEMPKTSHSQDDERVLRMSGLALAFMNARTPLSSQTIQQTYYPELSHESFQKAFLRDRTTLKSCGLVILPAHSPGQEGRWFAQQATLGVVDKKTTSHQTMLSSKADSLVIQPLEARIIEQLCAPLLDDPEFEASGELRFALAKISRAFAEHNLQTTITTELAKRLGDLRSRSSISKKLITTLKNACVQEQALDLMYTNASGTTTSRRVAPLGLFVTQQELYLAAISLKSIEESKKSKSNNATATATTSVGTTTTATATLDATAAMSATATTDDSRKIIEALGNQVRRYRVERIQQASPLKALNIHIPEALRSQDWRLMPFQVGKQIGDVTFYMSEQVYRELATTLPYDVHVELIARDCACTHARSSVRAQALFSLRCPMSSIADAASWAVAVGAYPVFPDDVREYYENILQHVVRTSIYEEVAKSDSHHKQDCKTSSSQENCGVLGVQENCKPLSTYGDCPNHKGSKNTKSQKVLRRGRTGAAETIRELLLLMSSLSDTGDSLNLDAVAERMGIDPARAQHLFDLLLMSSTDDYAMLPLVEDENTHELTLAFEGGLRGAPLELTSDEAQAIIRAFTHLGLSTGHTSGSEAKRQLPDTLAGLINRMRTHAPQRAATHQPLNREKESGQRVQSNQQAQDKHTSANTPNSSWHEVDSQAPNQLQPWDQNLQEKLLCIARSIVTGKSLSFRYQKPDAPKAEIRHMLPKQTVHSNGHWYVIGFDAFRQAPRIFNLDRMAHLTQVTASLTQVTASLTQMSVSDYASPKQGGSEQRPPEQEGSECDATDLSNASQTSFSEKSVTLFVHDAHMLDLLPWTRLILDDPSDCVNQIPQAHITYYGGSWLPRMLVAAAGGITTSDQALAEKTQAYAQKVLAAQTGISCEYPSRHLHNTASHAPHNTA